MSFSERMNQVVDEIAARSWKCGYFCAVVVTS